MLYPKYKQSKQFEALEKTGIDIVDYEVINNADDDIMKEQYIERKVESKYDVDGVVIVDNLRAYETTDAYPDHARAFKMQLDSDTVIATVKAIEWDISMDGYIKPRVRIDPVELSGVTVTYATGFNAKFININKLGAGAKVKLARSGDVIPYIIAVTKIAKSGEAQMPTYGYEWNDTHVDVIVDPDDEDAVKIIKQKQLSHFFNTMGIKHLGGSTLEKFVDIEIDTVEKILKANASHLTKLEGVGEKLVKKIYGEIIRSFEEVELPVFMAASHLFGRGLGVRKLNDVVSMYPNILSEKWTKTEMKENILLVSGFANKTADLFATNFGKFKQFYGKISKIFNLSRFENVESKITGNLFEDMKIVFTGHRNKEIEDFIKKNGGKITSSVSKNTEMVVHADEADTSTSKFVKANDLGVKLMSISAFKKKYL